MKIVLASVGFVVLLLLLLLAAGYVFTIGWEGITHPRLKCSCKEELKETIRQKFDADSVFLESSFVIMSGVPNLKTISVSIVNGTTDALDFKALPATYRRIDNLESVEDTLKKEIEPAAHLVFERCNSERFNNIAVYFCKYDSEGRLIIMYQYHFGEEFYPEKWKGYK